MGGELPRMGHLVEDEPAPQVFIWQLGRATPLLDVGLHEVEAGGTNLIDGLHPHELGVVLPQDAAAEERQQHGHVVIEAGAPELDDQRVGQATLLQHGVDDAPHDPNVQVQPPFAVQGLELRELDTRG